MDKADKILAHAARGKILDNVADGTREARAIILAAIDELGDIDEHKSYAAGALRGALPEIDRALHILRNMRGNVNRAIANTSRAKENV